MLPKEFDITGKVALITGAGRGIGRGIAEVLAEAGADIALNALTSKYVEKNAREIAENTGRRVFPVITDATRSESVGQMFENVFKEFEHIDILVNCLGDTLRQSLVKLPDKEGKTASDEDLRKIIDINMMAAVLCTRAIGPHFLERRSGKIINISSVTAVRGGGDLVIYSLAKSAVIGLTRTQALEWAKYNIQINSIAPGLFPDIHTYGPPRSEAIDRINRGIPMGRTGLVREVGLLALYLASPASNYMTGQTISLDGGMSL
jgi:NAD(P)-dependent dehydrogenase (short-subunit alcohol dehydrogenase family)